MYAADMFHPSYFCSFWELDHESILSLTANVKWLLVYFFLYFLCFEIFNNLNKSLAVSSELRCDIFLFENITVLLDVFEHFYGEKNKENPLVSW